MKVVFFAASEYGLQCIEAVKCLNDIEIVGIITTKQHYILRYGESQKKEMNNVIYNDLKNKSKSWKIPIYEICKMNDNNTIGVLRKWNPDVIVVSGWYHLIGNTILKLPPKGVIGLHASLLPKYRGGAPLVWQIINGEKETGITLFYMDGEVDTGDIIAQKAVRIEENDTIKTVYEKVGREGIKILIENLPLIKKGCALRKVQENIQEGDIYPQRTPEDGKIDWCQETGKIYDFIRAQTKPYPGAYIVIDGKAVKIWESAICNVRKGKNVPGTIIGLDNVCEKIVPVVATLSEDTALKILDYTYEDESEETSLQWNLSHRL